MKKNKFVIDGLIAIGLMLIIMILVLMVIVTTNNANKDLFEISSSFEYPFFQYILPIIVGRIKIFVSQIMLGLGLIGGAQIVFLIIKRTHKSM